MAKKRVNKQPPSQLAMSLFTPGMTVLHRAGLGGLACTLRYIERAYRIGALLDDEVPGGPWDNGLPPWSVDDHSVTLDFGSGDAAHTYLQRLFAIAFGIKDGLIYLPGQYPTLPPAIGIRAALQDGMLRSFYDHGPKSRSISAEGHYTVNVDEDSATFSFPVIEWYKHQRDGATIAYASLQSEAAVSRMLNPGAIRRHKFAATTLTHPAERLIPLLFAPVGTVALTASGRRVTSRKRKVFKAGAVLVIPDLDSLDAAPHVISALVPHSLREAKITSIGDAALGAEVRLHARRAIEAFAIPSIRAVWCCATDWMSDLQPPSDILHIDPAHLSEDILDSYELAFNELPPKIVTVKKNNPDGPTHQQELFFWANSVVRPLITNNLAEGRLWYYGFVRLMTMNDPKTNRPLREYVFFERKGLFAMTEKLLREGSGEATVVRAIHKAIQYRFGKIASENKGPSAKDTRIKRWKNEYERWRLAFTSSKTPEQLRRSLCDLFARAGINSVLQSEWERLLPMLDDSHWDKTRDLALLGLASYSGKHANEVEPGVEPEETKQALNEGAEV